jgi:hypothetical protein
MRSFEASLEANGSRYSRNRGQDEFGKPIPTWNGLIRLGQCLHQSTGNASIRVREEASGQTLQGNQFHISQGVGD